jgi:hypothetical protein
MLGKWRAARKLAAARPVVPEPIIAAVPEPVVEAPPAE